MEDFEPPLRISRQPAGARYPPDLRNAGPPWSAPLNRSPARLDGRSAVELLDEHLARIDASEPATRAWTAVDREGALAQARELDAEGPDPARPLRGIPIGVKDVIDVAGLPTTAASRVLAGNVARSDAPVVARLRAAGAVIVGKTNTQEFAYGAVSPPTTNPWDPGRIPGGSSGGSGAALAAGHCLGALGTDTAGSIRIPAALCGVVGLKPRPGLVSLGGVIPLAPSLDVVGPMARTTRLGRSCRASGPASAAPAICGSPTPRRPHCPSWSLRWRRPTPRPWTHSVGSPQEPEKLT